MLTPQQAAGQTFPRSVLNGYSMTRVDDFLDKLIPDYTALYEENEALKSRIDELTVQLGEMTVRLEEQTAREQVQQRAAQEAVHSARHLAGALLEEARRHQQAVQAALAPAQAPEESVSAPGDESEPVR